MYVKYLKRILDVLLAIFCLPFLGISLIIIAPAILITSGRPVFYNAPRVGKDGKIFKMYKFRSMIPNSPDIRCEDRSTFNAEDDPRVTGVGRILRKLSLDELPQIINVLKGDMSFIGPRPTLTSIKFEDYDEILKKRVQVRPGVTGYTQAYYRNSITQEEKYYYDNYYIDNISFKIDVLILWKTWISVLRRENVYVTAKKTAELTSSDVQ